MITALVYKQAQGRVPRSLVVKEGCEGSAGPPVAWGTHQEGPPKRIVIVTAMTYDSERAQSKISKQKGMWGDVWGRPVTGFQSLLLVPLQAGVHSPSEAV